MMTNNLKDRISDYLAGLQQEGSIECFSVTVEQMVEEIASEMSAGVPDVDVEKIAVAIAKAMHDPNGSKDCITYAHAAIAAMQYSAVVTDDAVERVADAVSYEIYKQEEEKPDLKAMNLMPLPIAKAAIAAMQSLPMEASVFTATAVESAGSATGNGGGAEASIKEQVSLTQIINDDEYCNQIGDPYSPHKLWRRDVAKAILDAAGVDYVE